MSKIPSERYICCFCLEPIEATEVDPLELTVRSLGSGADPDASAQALYAHCRHLKERIAASIPLVFDCDPN